MKVMVTGGAGFIGSNLVSLLNRKNHKVVVYDNLSTGYEKNLSNYDNVDLIVGDIRDENKLHNSMQGCETVFHLAASIGNVNSLRDPVLDSSVNVIGTLNVLNGAKKSGVRKIIYSSSAAIFGDLQYQPIDEKHPCEPDSPYGVSKLAAEKHCLWYGKVYGIDIVCLRYFNAYGVNQRNDEYGSGNQTRTNLLLRNKQLTIYGDGEQTRDFINVKDIAKANLLAAEQNKVSGVYNIGCGESITINKLSEIMKSIVGDNIKTIYAPPRKGEVLHCLADISLAKQTLDFSPSTDMYGNLLEYINWFEKDIC